MFGLLAAVGLSLVFGASLMWIFILLGLTMKTAQAVQGVAMLVLMPLQFGSSIFAKPTTMPGWLQSFTDYNPLSNLADAARGLMTGGPVAHSALMTLAWSVAHHRGDGAARGRQVPQAHLILTSSAGPVLAIASRQGGGLLPGEAAAFGVRGLVGVRRRARRARARSALEARCSTCDRRRKWPAGSSASCAPISRAASRPLPLPPSPAIAQAALSRWTAIISGATICDSGSPGPLQRGQRPGQRLA